MENERKGLSMIGGAFFIGVLWLTQNPYILIPLFFAITIGVAAIPALFKCPVCGGTLDDPKWLTVDGKRRKVCEPCYDEARRQRSRAALAK